MDKMERYAVVDIGTNSARLMIAETEGGLIRPVLKTLNTVRIGEGIGRSNEITEAAITRTVNALCAFKQTALEYEAKKIYFFATSAVRDAANKQQFVQAVEDACGLTVDVISGGEEARIGFVGAVGKDRRCGIIDIGGGSTEVIFGENDSLEFVKSFRVGTVRALSLYPMADKDAGLSYSAMREWVKNEIAELTAVPAMQGQHFIGIGGTATALASISLGLKEYSGEKVQGYRITLDRLIELYARLTNMTVEQRKHVTGLDSMRADVIGFGCSLMLEFMLALGLDEVEVSDRDNLEGYLLKKLEH